MQWSTDTKIGYDDLEVYMEYRYVFVSSTDRNHVKMAAFSFNHDMGDDFPWVRKQFLSRHPSFIIYSFPTFADFSLPIIVQNIPVQKSKISFYIDQ